MATDLGTTQQLMLTMAAKEGGWTTAALNHNQPLNNPFGVNIIKNGRAAGNKAERTVSVFADTNSLEYPDAKAAAAGELGLFQQGLRVQNPQIGGAELGGQPAATLSFQYRCSNQESRYVHVEVIAISPDGQYVYTIEFDGAADQDRLGQQIITGLKRSWRYLSAK